MKKIITSLILLFGVLSTLFAANVTLYYVNSTKWTTVNGYVWNKASDTPLTAWPGAAMTKTSETVKGFNVYSYTFDAAKYDRIIFNGGGQTGDLTFNASKPYYYEGKWYATLAEINGADAPAELTLYYVNTTKWTKVNAYAWIDGGAPLSAWPGSPATLMDKTVSGNQVYSYTFNPAMAKLIIFNNGVSQTDDLTIDATKPYFYNNKWVASVTFDATPVVPTPTYEPIYLRGNVNAWGVDDDWKLTTTDGNYFVANYAAGSEVELSGSFKLGSGTTDWTPYNFGADIVLEAGKSYVLTEGSYSPNINTSGKIKVSKIEFTLSTQTLKITGQTVEDKFDVTTDQGIALVENLDGTLQYIPLEFQANGVYTGVYTFAKSAESMPLFKVGGTADLNTIDFGDNGTSIIRLDQPYTLKRGSSNFVAINQTDLGSQGVDNGTKFDVTVTFTEDWGVTLKFVKQAEPVVTRITSVYVETFANTTINKTSIVNASYYLYYADEAVPTISGEDAAYFTLRDITLGEEFFYKGEPVRGGNMIITFAPTEARLYKATLTITSGDVSESVDFTAQGKAPNVTISNLQVPSFAVTEPFATTTVTATYNLANATEATATLGGDINAFSIVKQEVKDGVGSVQIAFTPGASGTYNARLVILSGDAEARVDFSATASQVDVDADKITIYARENRCDDNSVTFYCYNTADATSPSKTVHGTKVAGMYINGMDVYKVEIPFNNPIYVSAKNNGYEKQYIDSPIVKYYRDWKWYDSFDDCRFGLNLIDVNQKPEAGKLYVIEGNYVSGLYKVFSSKYGEDSGYSPTATTLDETFFGLTIKTYDVDPTIYDKVVYYYSPTILLGDKIENDIDWSKPYLCDGTWYASLADISTRIIVDEISYWVPFIGKDNKGIPGTQAVCKGNNVHESITQWNVTSETGKELDIVYALDPIESTYNGTNSPLGNAPAGYIFPCETVNKTIAVPEILGKYNLILTLDATAKEISAKWELIDTNVKVSLTNLFTGVSMEAVAANQYTYTYKKRIKAGLYYYSVSDKNNNFSKENQVVEVGEDGVYSFTFTYNATNKTVACKVEKVPSQEITLYYVNENTNFECDYAFAYVWIQSSGDFVATYPGEKMTDTGKTVDGYQVLSYTLDLAEADHILFNTPICGDKTADLTIDPAKPYYYQGEWHESLTFDEAPTGETTLYYVNKMGITDTEWENAFAYAYDNATGTPIVPWPGTPMGKLTKTIDGYDVFACTVDLSKADYIVFTNGQGGSLSQTMDLKIEPLKPYYYQLIWFGKLTFDDGTTEPGEILDPVLPDHEPIYLRGEVNNWGVDENYKLTSIDGIRYSVTYAPGSEIELYGNFKLASGNDTWYPFNFGAYPTKPIIKAGQDFVALRDGNDNIQVDGRILVSKIEFDLNTYTIKITGESQKFDITSDQGVSVVVYVGEESTFIPLTFTENGAYTGSFTVTDEDFSLKIAGTSDYNTINYGTNGTSAKFKFLYELKQSAFESITIDDEYEVGDVINVFVVFEEDWYAIMNLNRQAPMPDDGYEPLYLRGGITGWGADENFKLTTTDGSYYSAYYEAGSEVEITGAFKIASGSVDWTPYNFGGNFLVKAGENYILQSGGGDLEADGKIIASRIEFFMETKTLKITGVTQENKFDVTTDQGVSLAVNINAETTFIPLTFTQNGTYTGSYTVTDLDFMFKVGGEADFNTINYGTNGTPLILGTPYTLYKNAFESIIVGGDIQVGDVLDVVVSIGEDWITASMLVTKHTTPVDPDDENITLYYVNNEMWDAVNAYAWIAATDVPVVTWPGVEATLLEGTVDGYTVYSYTFERALADYIIFNDGNGSQTENLAIDATKPYYYDGVWYESLTFDTEPVDPVYPAIYLRGGVTNWGADENYKLTTTDGDYFVATYPAGSEVEILGSFKLGSDNANWTPYNFGGGFDIEVGKSYILVAGNQSANLNATGKIMASKIEFTLSTQTLIITGVTQENKFDVTTDQGVSLVAFVGKQREEIFNGLTFTVNGVYTGTYTIPEGEFFLKVAGAENYNIIDFGWNGNYIVLDAPYALKQGEPSAAAIYPGDWKTGDVLDVQVTFTEDWTVTLLLTKQEKPIVPDEPDVFISDISVPPFAETKVNASTQVTATFNIENATQAEAVIVDDEALVFSAATPVIDGTAGSVVLTFAPKAAGTYTANLFILSGQTREVVSIEAVAVEPEKPTITSISVLRNGACDAKYTFSEANNNTIIISEYIELPQGVNSHDFEYELLGNCDVNTYYDVLRTTVSESGVYDVTIQFNGDYENPSFSIAAAKGAMYLMGGINGWKPDANYKLTSTDGVNFVLECPKGQELELSGQFKIASADWGVYNFGAGRYLDAVESGKTYTLDGFNDISIAGNDVILVSKVEVNLFNDLETGYLVAALTITGVAQENLFDVNTDQGISFVEFNAGVENFNKLTFKGNGVYTGTYTYSADGVSFKVGGDGNFNVINYGTNGTDLIVGKAYIMQTGGIGSNVSFAPDADVLPGDVFDVAVVITSDWTVTLYLTKRDRPIDPDEPDVFISDISVPPFAETKVNASTQVTATFNIENATQATATIVGADANAFALSPVTIQDGVGSVRVIFSPLAIGVYEATLIIAAGDSQARVEMVAYAIEDSPSTAIDEAETLVIYAKEGTVYSEVEFEIYDLAGVNVTMLNGSLQGVYVVKTAEGNRLISVW